MVVPRFNDSSIAAIAGIVWLKDKRLSEAYYLIKKKNQKPQDFYLGLGFENISHFYTSFKQKYGMTPAEINQKHK